MAYTHSKYEVQMVPAGRAISASGSATTLNNIQLDVTGVVARYRPGFVPHIIRGAAVMSSATVQHDAAVHIGFEADISTAGTATRAFTIVLPTAGAQHRSVYYRPTYYIELKPGQTMDARVTAAATSNVDADIVLYVEPRWEEPSMIVTGKPNDVVHQLWGGQW